MYLGVLSNTSYSMHKEFRDLGDNVQNNKDPQKKEVFGRKYLYRPKDQ